MPLFAPWKRRSWLIYLAPFAAFLVLSALENLLPKTGEVVRAAPYAAAYAIKMVLVTAVAWTCRSTWSDLRPRPTAGWIAISVLLGGVVAALWIGLDGKYPALPTQEKRIGFDPGTLPASWRFAFTVVRLYGLILLVPLIEELFWRSFLIRWIAKQDFRSVPIGRITWAGALITSLLFAAGHPEWLPALLTGLLWVGLLWRSRSVATCWISHLVANLLLGIYILTQGAWQFW